MGADVIHDWFYCGDTNRIYYYDGDNGSLHYTGHILTPDPHKLTEGDLCRTFEGYYFLGLEY